MPGEPFILNFAPTGVTARPGGDHFVPLEPERIVEEVLEAAELGITLVHLHVRDDEGRPTLAPERYAALIEAIRAERPELVVCISLSGRRGDPDEARAAPLALEGEAKPDMASLTLSSLNFSREPSMNSPATVSRLAAEMQARGVVPELEAFDTGMINAARYLLDRGRLDPPLYVNLLLGNLFTAQADPLSLGAMLSVLPEGCLWAAGGLGRFQAASQMLALAAGGGVRTGLEDNVFADLARTRPAGNRETVERAHRMAELLERPLMSSATFRERMRMLPGKGAYGREPHPAEGDP
jgi:uncharacterized protein (DUF849 family)